VVEARPRKIVVRKTKKREAKSDKMRNKSKNSDLRVISTLYKTMTNDQFDKLKRIVLLHCLRSPCLSAGRQACGLFRRSDKMGESDVIIWV